MKNTEYMVTDIEIENEKYIRVDGYVHYHKDINFGSDADGNRGETRTIVDEVTSVQGYDENDDEIQLNEKTLYRAEQALARKFLES